MSFARGFNEGANMVQGVYGLYQKSKQDELMQKANAAATEAYTAYGKQFEPRTEDQVTLASGGTAGGNGGMSLGTVSPGLANTQQVKLGDASQIQQPMAGGLSLDNGQAPIPTKQVQVQPTGKFNEEEGILSGMTARRKYLMSNGADPDLWGADFAKESALRERLRTKPINDAYNAYTATGDFGAYVKQVYPLINDGMEVSDAKQELGVDGKPQGWRLTIKGSDGKDRPVIVGPEQERRLLTMSASPEQRVGYELKVALAEAAADARIRAGTVAHGQASDLEDQRHGNRGNEIAAAAAQARKTKAAVSGDKRAELGKPLVLGEGQIAVSPGKDGKYETKAEGRPRTLGNTAAPSAGNRVMDLRREASEAIRTGKDANKVRERFREMTGEDF